MITKWKAVRGKKCIRSRKNGGRTEYQARKRVGNEIKEGPIRAKVWEALNDLEGFKVKAAAIKVSVSKGGKTGFGHLIKSYLNDKISESAKATEEEKWKTYIVPFLILNEISEPWHFTTSKVDDWVRHLNTATWSRPGSNTTSPLSSFSKSRLTSILWGVLKEGKRLNESLVIPKEPKFKEDSQSLNRDLTPSQIRTVFNNAPPPPQPHRAILSIVFLTGMGADVLKWKRSRILGPITPETFILVSRSKTDHAKKTKVPLGELAAKELVDLGVDTYGPDEWLFKSRRNPGDHIKSLKGFLKGQSLVLKLGKTLPLHAFRHAFATYAREEGVDALTLAQILGHKDLKMIHQVYDHSQVKREVVESVSNKMRGRVSDRAGSHVTIPTQLAFKILHIVEKQNWNLACDFAKFFPYGVEEYRDKLL